MKTRFIIAYVLNLFDLAITTHWVNKYGIEIEGNPVGRWLYETGWVYPVKIIGIGVALFALYVGIKKHAEWEWTSWLVLAVYSLLAIYHIYICLSIGRL